MTDVQDTASAMDFYAEFTRRNRGFIADATQRRLAAARLLVAGCGSTGGAAVEPLVRMGVQELVLADAGEFELNNLNRQAAGFADLGRNKAEVAAERITAINPHARTVVVREGVTADNIEALVDGCTVVVDGVDVTERSGWRAKYLLHEAAARAGVPVVSGWDMAGRQYVRYYDYRRPGARPFDGRITASMVERSMVWSLMYRAVPLRYVPVEMVKEARAHLGEPGYSVPQLVYTSMLFGALVARMVSEILAGEQVRRDVVLDVHHAVRTGPARWRTAAQWMVEVAGGLRELAARTRAHASATANEHAESHLESASDPASVSREVDTASAVEICEPCHD